MPARLETEIIPDEDRVSRWLFDPPLGDDLTALGEDHLFKKVFEFEGGKCESLLWRKYASTIEEVHDLGCKQQRLLRTKGRDKTYMGAITGVVGEVRTFKNINGHGFDVVHRPDGDQGIQHAEVCYALALDKSFTRNDKAELRLALVRQIFTEVNDHQCP
jgi:hypothetical protein